MKSLLTKVKMDMTLKGYSPKTIQAYLRYIREFSAHFDKSPADLDTPDIKQFLYFLTAHKKVSYSYIKAAYSALKFMYKISLRRHWDSLELPRAKAPKKLPVILSTSEIQKIFNATTNLKYKAIFVTIYSAGLRISEVQNLKIIDIDSSNMQIFIRGAKGKKDRYTLLSKTNLKLLRDYWRVYRPKDWLFPGRNPSKPISARSI